MHLFLHDDGRHDAGRGLLASVTAHAGVVLVAVIAGAGGSRLPLDEREARVFFLLPPDREIQEPRQSEILQWGIPGIDPDDGKYLSAASEGGSWWATPQGARGEREGSGARGQVPFGPPARLSMDTAFSVLEVDETVMRHLGSAAPVYPPELAASGAEGLVHALYVVDTTGRVDTTTIRVLRSDDPAFTQSVRDALRHTRFRPARRAGAKVRQEVLQQFRFRIAPAGKVLQQIGALPPGGDPRRHPAA